MKGIHLYHLYSVYWIHLGFFRHDRLNILFHRLCLVSTCFGQVFRQTNPDLPHSSKPSFLSNANVKQVNGNELTIY